MAYKAKTSYAKDAFDASLQGQKQVKEADAAKATKAYWTEQQRWANDLKAKGDTNGLYLAGAAGWGPEDRWGGDTDHWTYEAHRDALTANPELKKQAAAAKEAGAAVRNINSAISGLGDTPFGQYQLHDEWSKVLNTGLDTYNTQINAAKDTYEAAQQKSESYLDPYRQASDMALGQIKNLLGLGTATPQDSQQALNALKQMPGYQFQLQQGQEALNASQSAKGLGFSGNTLAAATKYNQDYASTAYQANMGYLTNLIQMTPTAANAQANLTTSNANAMYNAESAQATAGLQAASQQSQNWYNAVSQSNQIAAQQQAGALSAATGLAANAMNNSAAMQRQNANNDAEQAGAQAGSTMLGL